MKTKFKHLTKILGSTALVTTLVCSTLAMNACTSLADTKATQDPDNAASYCYVNFLPIDSDTKIVGETHPKVKVGSYFASVTQPTATRGGQRFQYWAKKVDTNYVKVEPKDVITADLTVYPIFENQTLLSNCLGFTAIEETTITLVNGEDPGADIVQDLQVTNNYGDDWKSINDPDVEWIQDHSITLQPGQNIFFKGDNEDGFNKYDPVTNATETTIFTFSEGGLVNMGGSIMSLIDNATGTATNIPNNYCFAYLFSTDEPSGHYPAIRYVSSTFLPSETLTGHCYDQMFRDHSTLLYAPELPATTLTGADGCYNDMFSGCSSLDYLKIGYTGNFPETEGIGQYTDNWVEGVSDTGKIIYNGSATTHSDDALPTGWAVEKSPTPQGTIEITCPSTESFGENYEYVDNHPYQFVATVPGGQGISQDVTWTCTNTSIADVNPSTGIVTGLSPGECQIIAYSKVDHSVWGYKTIKVRDIDAANDCLAVKATVAAKMSWDYTGTGSAPEFKYSTNKKDWLRFWTNNPITIGANETIYIKGNNASGLTDGATGSYTYFSFENATTSQAKVQLSGDVMGLIDDGRGEQDEPTSTIPCNYCFQNLFQNQTEITAVSSNFLPVVNLTKGCYKGMFSGCSNLTSTPALNASTLKDECYMNMFGDCTSLTATPDLPAETLAVSCYAGMFSDCTKLAKTSILPATKAKAGCYQFMFDGCIGLDNKNSTIGYVYLDTLADLACCQMFADIATVGSRFKAISDSGWSAMFVCPSVSGFDNPTQGMFCWQTLDPEEDPTTDQTWYYQGNVLTKEGILYA